jgi:hypothetical protein
VNLSRVDAARASRPDTQDDPWGALPWRTMASSVPQLVELIRSGAPNAARREAADAFAASGVRDSLKRLLTVALRRPVEALGLRCR